MPGLAADYYCEIFLMILSLVILQKKLQLKGSEVLSN